MQLTFSTNLGADIVFFGARGLEFGMSGASAFDLGGPSSDPVARGSTRREFLGSRLGFLLTLGRFRDPTLKGF